MKPRYARILGAALVATLAISCAPTIPSYRFTYSEFRHKVDNGARLVVMPDKGSPMVEVDVRYEVGSNEDPPGKAGLAHMVEHMMFQQRPWGEDKPAIWSIIPQVSVIFNAYTNWDMTHYMLLARKENLETLINLEAARLGYGCKTIPEDAFEREREVVRNEIRQRGGTPEGQIEQILLSAVYPKGHAYDHTVGGDDAQIASITLQDVCEFMDKYYVPARATLIVAGNVDPQEVGQLFDKYFGTLEARSPAPRKPVEPIELEHKRVDRDVDIERTQVHVAWKLPPAFSKDDDAARFMIGVLAGRVASFAEDWEFAAAVYPQVVGGQLAPVFVVSVELRDDGDVGEALEFIWKAARGAHRFFEEGMFDDSKALMKADYIRSLEPLFFGRNNTMGDYIQFDKSVDWDSSDDHVHSNLKRIDQMDGGRMRSFIKSTLDPDKAVVVVVHASKKGLKGDTRAELKFQTKTHEKREESEVDPAEAKHPIEAPAVASAVSEATRFTLGNGMRVVLLPFSAMPIMTVELVFDAGSAQEPPGLAGLAAVAARYVNPPEGSDALGRTGLAMGGYAGDDTTTFEVSGMAYLDEVMLKVLERVIKVGDYRQESIERGQKRFKISLESKQFRQRQAFGRELSAAVYGPEHPYTTNGPPTRASIGKLGRDVAFEFKSTHYSAKNATLIIAGAFDLKRVEGMVRDIFGEWSGGHADQPVSAALPPRHGPIYVGVIGDDNPQAQVQMAYPGPPGVDGQEAARMVLAEMLNIRMAAVREKLGASYGTYAGRSTRRGPSIYIMGGSVDGERAGESLAAMRSGIDSLRRGEDFDRDFARARRRVMTQILGESSQSAALAGQLAFIAEFNLPADYFDKLVKYVAVVSPAQVKALLDAELRPELEVIVCLGDKKTLEKMFAEASLQNVKYVDVE